MQQPSDVRTLTVGTATRRRLLGLCGTAAATGLAGCGGSGDDGGDSTPDDAGDEATPTATAAGGDDASSGGSNAFGETIQSASSYAIEGTTSSGATTGPIEGRIHEGDFYMLIEPTDDPASEFYSVDGTQYVVSGGQCFITGQREDAAPARIDDDREAYADLSPSGRDTIDGQDVFVYDLPAEDGGSPTYYVSTETGYPVRFESNDSTFSFHSWGDVDPITAPDMECQEMGGGGTPPSNALAAPLHLR
jgi:hypothetical protein